MHPKDDKASGPTERQKALNSAQAKALREQASKGGLRFEAFLPPNLAEWVLDLVERGVFLDPKEAAFVMFGEMKDFHAHADLRQELLKRMFTEASDDSRPSSSMEDIREHIKKLSVQPRPVAAQWQKVSADNHD